MFEHPLNKINGDGGADMDRSASREHALDHAVTLHADRFAEFGGDYVRATRELLTTASSLYNWLVGPASLSLVYGEIEDQAVPHNTTGRTATAMTQLHDDERFSIELTAQDAKGAEVLDDATTAEDNPTFVSSDEAVFTYVVDPENPRKAEVVAGLPGSAVGTVSIGDITVTHAIDVVAGGIATVTLTEGDIEKQGTPTEG